MGWCTPLDGALSSPCLAPGPLPKQARQTALLHSSNSTHSLHSAGHREDFGVAPKKRGNTYFFNSDKFEHRLLLKDFSASAMSSASVFISTEVHSLFLQSQHPTILTSNHSEDFPNPVEWCFFTDELVHTLYESSDCNLDAEVQQQYKGSLENIRNIELKHIEVELKSGELATFE